MTVIQKSCSRALCGKEFSCSETNHRKKFCSLDCQRAAKHDRWFERNRERELTRMREYHAQNREAANTRSIAYYRENRDAIVQQMKEKFQATRRISPWVILLRNAKERAKKRGLPCDLTEEWLKSRWTGNCEITKLPLILDNPAPGPRFNSPTIDRKDPKLGYVRSNTRIVRHGVNALKADGTDADMLEMARAIVENYTLPS